MSKKQYRDVCRKKVEFLAKFITWFLVMAMLIVSHTFNLDGHVVAIVSTTIWFFGPDLAAYALESYYKIKHLRGVYR